MARKLTGILDQDTIMMPWIMADGIVGEAALFVRQMREDNGDLLERMADELATKAMRVYAASHRSEYDRWARNIRGKHGGATLFGFMRHWISGMVIDRFGIRPPAAFCNGASIDDPRVVSEFVQRPERWDVYQPALDDMLRRSRNRDLTA